MRDGDFYEPAQWVLDFRMSKALSRLALWWLLKFDKQKRQMAETDKSTEEATPRYGLAQRTSNDVIAVNA